MTQVMLIASECELPKINMGVDGEARRVESGDGFLGREQPAASLPATGFWGSAVSSSSEVRDGRTVRREGIADQTHFVNVSS